MSEVIKPIRLQIKAGEATPAPPIGSTLAPKKIKVVDFCREFNDRTKQWPKGTPLSVRVFVLKNNSFKLEIKQPLTSYLLKTAAQVDKGSGMPNKNKVGSLTLSQLKAIAGQKMVDLNAHSLEAAIRILSGTAKSMGIEVRGEG
jgi:large subunit ribosomal protein L11